MTNQISGVVRQPDLSPSAILTTHLDDIDHRVTPKDYALGLAFCHQMRNIVLIRKVRPKWQAGRWNGVGGKIEEKETPLHAMQREFWEETGVTGLDWHPLARVKGLGWKMHVFQASSHDIFNCRTMEEEEIRIFHVNHAMEEAGLISSIRFYIPLAIETGNGLVKPIHLEYDTEK